MQFESLAVSVTIVPPFTTTTSALKVPRSVEILILAYPLSGGEAAPVWGAGVGVFEGWIVGVGDAVGVIVGVGVGDKVGEGEEVFLTSGLGLKKFIFLILGRAINTKARVKKAIKVIIAIGTNPKLFEQNFFTN